MPQIETDLMTTRENAKRLRFEQTALVPETNVQDAIERVAASAADPPEPTPTAVAASPYAVLPTDRILEIGVVPCIVNLDAAANHVDAAGAHALVIKDVTGNASNATPITINRSGAETIDGMTATTIENAYGGYRLRPVAGVGWRMDP